MIVSYQQASALHSLCLENHYPATVMCIATPAQRTILGNLRVSRRRQAAYTSFVSHLHENARSTVLLVDDDPLVLELCASCLRNAGFLVKVAANGRDAQALFREDPASIQLVLTDVEMPFVSGIELADFVAASGSSCPVLLVSGSLAPPEAQRKGWDFLAKPFTPSVLIGAVQRLARGVRKRPRALLAEDDSDMRNLLCELLDAEYDLVAVLDGGESVLETSELLHPDVIILDISMPDVSGLAVARSLRESIPQTPVVFVTQHTGSAYVEAAFANGASGYVTKRHIFSELSSALQEVRAGGRYLSADVRAE
jgi:CheY-like chemotaxis protein